MKTKTKKPTAAEITNPRDNLAGFRVQDAIADMQSAVTDSNPFYARCEKNERTRLCLWEGKNGTGRKIDTPKKKARPWNYASDQEVHLTQSVLQQLTALRTAALLRGGLTVTPMEGTDARASGQMKQVLRYYLETAMGPERLIQGTRWASWSLRYGHAVMYIGWKTVKALEPREVLESELIDFIIAKQIQTNQESGEPLMVADEQLRTLAEQKVRSFTNTTELADLLIEMRADLKARGKAAKSEAMRCIEEMRANATKEEEERKGTYYAVFVKEDRPTWECLRQGVDFFCPAETVHQATFDEARFLARQRWLSAQQVREEGALRGWSQEWIVQVLAKCKGRSHLFGTHAGKYPWVMSGLGVGYATGAQTVFDGEKNLYQIIEYYDRKCTEDGVQCLYRTVLHPDIHGLVAKRELLPDWHGHYPFVAATNEQDEPLLLANRGVPEICFSPQQAIKTQVDSRDDMASLTVQPPWTGPEGLAGTEIAPGVYIPSWRSGEVTPFKLPPPDSRSIEIEQTLRAEVDRYFGLMSEKVPEALSMLLGQTGVDWFLNTAYSRAVALTAQLIQQRMPKLTGARITGTEIVFDATREGVRGNYDFQVKFDVRALDLDWLSKILDFVRKSMEGFDNKNLTQRRVFLEMAYNFIDPSLADRALPMTDDEAAQSEIDAMESVLNKIFSGGVPTFTLGVDYGTRAEEMQRDLRESPVRQQIMASNEQIAAVWQDYLQRLLHQIEQEGANKQAGIEGGSDPLRQSPLARLKAGGWQAMMPAAA